MPKTTEGVYERSDSAYLWITYTDANGKRVRRSSGILKTGGTQARREAEALLGKWKSEVHQERMWGRPPEQSGPNHTFDDVMLAYFRDRVAAQRTGFKRARSTAKPLYVSFTGKQMNDITDIDIKAYIRQRQADGAASGTINKEIGMFSAACNYAADDLGWSVSNPAAAKKVREPEGRVRWIERDEAVRLIKAAVGIKRAPWIVDFVQLALNTGCRMSELLWLEWVRVDLRADMVTLDNTKNGKRRSVPLNESAKEAIMSRARYRAEHCPESPWVFCKSDGKRITTLRRSFKAACEKAGITDFRIHDQRHTLASWLVIEGVPLVEVRDTLGHSTVKMTERYAHLSPENVRAAVGKIQGVSRLSHVDEA